MKLNSNRARSFAETRWGRGGTSAYRTNRKGAYYFSCSGHGGYVVDGEALTAEEREKIDQHVKPTELFYAATPDGCYFLQNPDTFRRQRYRIYGDTVTGTTQIYFFEEDCEWAVLERFTDIRAAGHVGTEEQLAASRERTFQSYYTPEGRAAFQVRLPS